MRSWMLECSRSKLTQHSSCLPSLSPSAAALALPSIQGARSLQEGRGPPLLCIDMQPVGAWVASDSPHWSAGPHPILFLLSLDPLALCKLARRWRQSAANNSLVGTWLPLQGQSPPWVAVTRVLVSDNCGAAGALMAKVKKAPIIPHCWLVLREAGL